MPCVHGTKGVLTNEVESTLPDLVLISGDHCHRTVRSEIPVEQLQEARLVTSPCPSRTHQGARYLYTGPSAGDEPGLEVREQRRRLFVSGLVGQVGARQHRGVEVDDHTRSRSSARSWSTTGPVPFVDARIRRRLEVLTTGPVADPSTPNAAARARSRVRRSPSSASTAASRISLATALTL